MKSSVLDDLGEIAKRTHEIQKEENRQPILMETENNESKTLPFIPFEDAPRNVRGTILFYTNDGEWHLGTPFIHCAECTYDHVNHKCCCLVSVECCWWSGNRMP